MIRFTVLVVLVGLVPCAAGDEGANEPANIEARTHYQAGQKHYDRGEYDEAIAEFETAYRRRPHPNVLYNIAQAYERLLEYAKSVDYFERYLTEAPADAEFRTIVENRLRILRGLPARISITTSPEHVQATLVQGDRRVSGETPHLFKVPAGEYEIVLDAPGCESERHRVRAEIGQPYFYQYRLKHSTSKLSIFTRPRGARVFIDDRLVGDTPFAQDVEVGRHRLLLEHPDYPWHREEFEVKAGTPFKLELKLKRPVRSGRTELVIASMVYGGVAGPLLVAALSGSSGFASSTTGLATFLLSSIAGIGIGFLGSFLPTRDGIKVGHSSLIIGGGAWGTAIGASLALGLEVPAQYAYGMSILGGGIGILTGALIARWRDTSAGDAAVVNSGGFWGTATGAMLAQSIFLNPTGAALGWFMLGGTSLGLFTSSLIAWKLEYSRGHVALVDVGGLAGTGLGIALGFAIAAGAGENGVQAASRYGLGGMVLGILTAAVLARNYKGDLRPVDALLSNPHGRWAFSLPKIEVETAITPEGVASRYMLQIAHGRW